MKTKKVKIGAEKFYKSLKDNPEEIIKFCETEIAEYQKLINLIRMDQINTYRKKCKLPKIKLKHCKKCNQMTNHNGKVCMKCITNVGAGLLTISGGFASIIPFQKVEIDRGFTGGGGEE